MDVKYGLHLVQAEQAPSQYNAEYAGLNISERPLNPIACNAKIAELAYSKAALRHFKTGYELEDWLEAERELGLK